MIQPFRELFMNRLHTQMSKSQSPEVVQFGQEIKTKPFHEQIRMLFSQIPRFYGHVHMELLTALSGTLGYAAKTFVLQSLQQLGCVPTGQASMLCGPRFYQLNADGELELFADLSVTCRKGNVLFISVKCTKYDLICDSALRLICERIQQQLIKQLNNHHQVENPEAV
ncbi:hypothetical protein ACFOU2_17685 [Bacillus songklensis]|uniref:Condensation domain-containing protein n=1 Tax=Bacillus songklensis TaxID=1069116 RepID=A0ABV8B6P3_9BACI